MSCSILTNYSSLSISSSHLPTNSSDQSPPFGILVKPRSTFRGRPLRSSHQTGHGSTTHIKSCPTPTLSNRFSPTTTSPHSGVQFQPSRSFKLHGRTSSTQPRLSFTTKESEMVWKRFVNTIASLMRNRSLCWRLVSFLYAFPRRH